MSAPVARGANTSTHLGTVQRYAKRVTHLLGFESPSTTTTNDPGTSFTPTSGTPIFGCRSRRG